VTDTAVASSPTISSSTLGPRILCVEDDPGFRITLATSLGELGFDVRCAANGPDALEAFDAGRPELVVCDLGLPGMDGLALCKALKARRGEAFLPVIFLTGQADTETMAEALEEGGDDFCSKPVRVAELVARIKAQLRVAEREERLAQLARGLRDASLSDALTGLGNRRAMDAALAREWARAERTSAPLALVLIDVDRFKLVNDRYGHACGDEVLVAVGRAIKEAVREGDQVFRFGGEEFAVIAPVATVGGILQIGERVRRAVAALVLPYGPVTVSVGVGLGPTADRPTTSALFQTVDHALYAAKSAGRNRIVAATSPRAA
jgi:two-component system cell cycle response regulator